MFTGSYYDGKTSRAHAALIDLGADGIYISTTDAEMDKVMIVWDVDSIHRGHFSNNERITLRYGSSPVQYLEISDPHFYQALTTAYPGKKFNDSGFDFLRRNGTRGVLALVAGLIVVVVVSYFWILPPAAEFMAGKMPVSMEVRLGDEMYDKIIEGYTIDQHLTKEANEYWRAMHISSPYTVNITVVHQPVANAFALPGGQIIIYDEIISRMTDYDELAGLLAHEYSHIQMRHSLKMMSRNLSGYIFVSLLLNDASGTLAVLATNANSLKELGYSRQLEHQADEKGYDLLQSANISPDGMLKLFRMLKDESDDVTMLQFVSTHPLTGERIAYIKDRLKKDKSSYTEHEDLKKIWQEMKSED